MQFHLLQIVTVASVVLALAAICWLLIINFRREQYTREKFAFVALSGISGMALSIVSALADRETPWAPIEALARAAFKLPAKAPEPPHVADHLLMIFVLILMMIFVSRIYENWTGAFSVRQKEKQKYFEPMPLIGEGLHEAARILRREPEPPIFTKERQATASLSLEPPEDKLAWHLHARDLLCLRSPSFIIDPDRDWHEEARCWVGINTRTQSIVAIKCQLDDPDTHEVQGFINYVRRVADESLLSEGMELILAIRNSISKGVVNIGGIDVKVASEETLLDGLVNFADYFATVKNKVEKQSLTDSSLTLSNVYTTPRCRDEDNKIYPDLEEYVVSWLNEKSQRQLSLLGEYGQGKSTSALMLTYHLINSEGELGRIPILVELRGKSLRHMTPSDLIASWAAPYRIHPLAVMKLLIAGRIFLILEGFDEMALIGDSEARLSHFRTLWQFCFPKAKIMITGRPNFFLDDEEMRVALGIQRSDAAGLYCEALHLEPFTIPQIKDALRSVPEHTRDEIVSLAQSDRKFQEIVSRGSLLYVVSQLWEREKLNQYSGLINSAVVMDLFIKHSYRRQTTKVWGGPNFMILNEGERQYFMSGIAATMAAQGLPNQISSEQLNKAVKHLYDVIPKTASRQPVGVALTSALVKPLRDRLGDAEDPIQDVENDVRSSGLLVFDQSKTGSYKFAHKSFMEFLIAEVYSNFIADKDRDISSALVEASKLSARQLFNYPESVTFLGELLLATVRKDLLDSRRKVGELLFYLIVVRPNGNNQMAKIRGKLGLATLKSEIMRYANRKEKNSFRRALNAQAFLLLRPELFPLLMMVLLIELPVMRHLVFDEHVSHIVSWGTAAVVLMGTSQYLTLISRNLQPSLRLWLMCCVTMGVDPEDVGRTGRGLLKAYQDSDIQFLWMR